MWPSSFEWVRLTAAAREAIGSVRITNHHVDYQFRGDEPVKIVRAYEWTHVLSRETFNGEPMFELCDAPVTAKKSKKTATAEEVTEDGGI